MSFINLWNQISLPYPGLQGDYGPTGIDGTPGIDGEAGIDGSRGMKGGRGENGLGTLVGEWGEQGDTGDIGEFGDKGKWLLFHWKTDFNTS